MFDSLQPNFLAGLVGALISIFLTKFFHGISVLWKRRQVLQSMQGLDEKLRPVLEQMVNYDATFQWTKEQWTKELDDAKRMANSSWYKVNDLLKLNEIIHSPTSDIYTTMKVAHLVAAEAAARAAVDGVKERVAVQRDGEWVLRPPTSPAAAPRPPQAVAPVAPGPPPAVGPLQRSPWTPRWPPSMPLLPRYRRQSPAATPHTPAPAPAPACAPPPPPPPPPPYAPRPPPGWKPLRMCALLSPPPCYAPRPPPGWKPLPLHKCEPPPPPPSQRRKDEKKNPGKKEKNNIPFEKERRKEDEKKREKSRKGEKNRHKEDKENKKNEMEKGDSKDPEGKKIKEAAKTKEEEPYKQKSSQENKKERCPEEEMPHHQHHREEEEARKEENEEKMAPYEKECKNLLSSSEDPLRTISSSHQEEIHPQGLPRLPRRRRRGGGIREYGHGNEADASAHPHLS